MSSVARCFLPYLRMESNAYNAHSWRALCYPMPRASERHKWLLRIYSLCSSGSASLLIITSEATLSAYLIEGIAPSAQSVHRASFAYRSHYRHTCIHLGWCRSREKGLAATCCVLPPRRMFAGLGSERSV